MTARYANLLLPLLLLGSAAAAQRTAPAAHLTTPHIVAGAVLGSAGGVLGGVTIGRWAARRAHSDPEDGLELLAGLAGSALGTAVGAHMGARVNHRRVSFGRRLRDAGAGTLIGGLVALAVGGVTDKSEPVVIAFSLTQGLYVGLSNGRW